MSVLNARAAIAPLNYGESALTDYVRHVYTNRAKSGANIQSEPQEQEFRANGDHITVSRVDGPGILQLRFGNNLPWIDIAQGMVLHRRFDRFWVREIYAINDWIVDQLTPATTAVIFSSYGPLILERPQQSRGFRAGFVTATVSILANTNQSLDFILAGALGSHTFGGRLIGGTVLIKCTPDSPSPIAFTWNRHNSVTGQAAWAGNPLRYWVIDIGETMSIDFDNDIGSTSQCIRSGDPSAQVDAHGITIEPLINGLNGRFSIMFNPGQKLTSQYWTQAHGLGAPLPE